MPAVKLFFVTDIHGSEICWRKFLNAGSLLRRRRRDLRRGHHRQGDGPDRPASAAPGTPRFRPSWRPWRPRPRSVEFEKQDDEPRLLPDPGLRRGVPSHAGGRGRWSTSGSRRSCSKAPSAGSPWPTTSSRARASGSIVCPANDDMFEIDPLLKSGNVVESGGGTRSSWRASTMISYGWTNPTPWDTFRELPEEELGGRIEKSLEQVKDPETRSSTSTRRRSAAAWTTRRPSTTT